MATRSERGEAAGELGLADSLFGRAFLLIALLIVFAVAASFQLYRVYEREPRARELAQQTVSVVNLVRAALVNAAPERRPGLLYELNEREGLRLFPAQPGEILQPLPQDPLFAQVAARVRAALGERTRFAFAREDIEGFWVSFLIDGDEFWAMLPRERFEPVFGLAWAGWGALLLALALAGAWAIASRLSRPLADLTRAADKVGRGETPERLDESGLRELRRVAAAFNRMASDLDALERERATVLAGISHDLRTPLARLRLALEMAGTDAATAEGMGADINEIDTVIGQFLDYARGEDAPRSAGDLDALAREIVADYERRGHAIGFSPGLREAVRFAPAALRRALSNLLNNALRHGGEPIAVHTRREAASIVIEVMDRGPGIPSGEAERLKRPFTRLDSARGSDGGSGLGLAIAERIARQHGGSLELAPRAGGGLAARLRISAD